MNSIDKKTLSERDICTKFITPAVQQAGWDIENQIREEVFFTKGRIIVRGKLVTRGKAKFADYILYYKPNIPIALIEAKDNTYPVGGGLQQALEYADTLGIPFVFSSNGDAFLFHDRTGQSDNLETDIPLAEQHRIVAKVDELMALCNQLETQLTTTQTETRHLLAAVLHETLVG